MEEIKQRIKNIRFWHRRMAVSAVMIVIGVLPNIFPAAFGGIMDALWKNDVGAFFAFILFGIGPLVGAWFLFMGWCAISELKIRCRKCNNIISFKEAEAMGDEFICPYCMNGDIKMNYPQTVQEVSQQTERILYRVIRSILRNMK